MAGLDGSLCPDELARSLPERTHGNRKERFIESETHLAIVENDAAGESLPCHRLELSEPSEIGGGDGRGCFCFHSDDLTSISFEDDVDLIIVTITKMIEVSVDLRPARLAAQLLDYKCLEELTEEVSIALKGGRIQAKKGAGEPRVSHVKFRCFDKPAHSVHMPWRKLLEEEESSEEIDVASNRRP